MFLPFLFYFPIFEIQKSQQEFQKHSTKVRPPPPGEEASDYTCRERSHPASKISSEDIIDLGLLLGPLSFKLTEEAHAQLVGIRTVTSRMHCTVHLSFHTRSQPCNGTAENKTTKKQHQDRRQEPKNFDTNNYFHGNNHGNYCVTKQKTSLFKE